MQKKIFIYLIIGLLGLASSCKKDSFLNRQPESSLTAQNFFNDATDLNTYCNGLYSYLPGWGIAIADQQSDNMETNGYNKIVAGQIQVPTDAATAQWTWSYLYQVNYFLSQYNKAQATDAVKAHYAGIARFFRAWFYFDKVKRFGDVPWYGNTMEPSDTIDLYKPRDPRALVMDSVLADLRYAAANNMYTTPGSTPSGTINQFAALALLARVGLHEGTYRKYHGIDGWQPFLQVADSAAKDIMTGAQYKLYSTGNPTQDYYNLFNTFTPSDPQNAEIILGAFYSSTLHYTHPLDAELNAGYGLSLTKDLVNTYLMQTGTPFTSQPGYDTMEFYNEFTGRDPRMAQTIIGPQYQRQGQPYAPLLGPAPTGYEQIKYYVDDPSQTSWNTSYNAALLMRYAEVLLIEAEAKAELSTLQQSDLDATINVLRDRVGMPHLTMNVTLDPVLAAAYPAVSSALILEIRRERRVELACEGFRYDDLMRWKSGALLALPFHGMYFPGLGAYDINHDGKIDFALVSSLPTTTDPNIPAYLVVGTDIFLTSGNSGNVWPYPTLVKTFDENKNYLFPLPTTELMLNPNLTQNPGW
jgi:starch-binding outer membrane protein, SusD/RagB family